VTVCRDIFLPLSGCGRLDREAREQKRDEQNRVQPDAGVSWERNSNVRFVEFHKEFLSSLDSTVAKIEKIAEVTYRESIPDHLKREYLGPFTQVAAS
jgi:hypothetical protein